jgi:hypothetical protein
MKKLFEQESIEALETAGFIFGAMVYSALFGFMWGMVLLFYLAMFFFIMPLVWKQSSHKNEKIGLLLLGLWWLLPIFTLLF